MEPRALTPEEKANLSELQGSSLTVIALFVGLIGYVWLVVALWRQARGGGAPLVAWVPPALLILSAVAGVAWRKHLRGTTPALLLASTLAVTAYGLATYRIPDLAYLFVLSVAFASVLLDRCWTFLLTVVAIACTAAIGTRHLALPLFSLELALPVGVIALASIASWLAARNLSIAGEWAWNGYNQARQHAALAREQQSELRKALKAMDEATYRLERANQMLALAHDQAEEARRLKQHFAQTVSHELRTPLNLIVGFTEMMVQSPEYYGAPFPPALARDLSAVYRNARHLQTLISDVLDLARIEAAQMAILPEETDPAALAEEAVNTARALVEARGLALHTEIEPGLPRLWVDPIRIRQVLFNLLNNAARFTEQGSVTIRVRNEGGNVLFAVADTGIGIASEEIPRIFREFEQIDAGTRRRRGGVGLGLAISKQFVELHGGRIWVESEPGKGSTFSFSLPVTPPSLHAHEAPSVRTPCALPARWHTDRVVLVVTRSPAAVTLLTRYLRGHRVATASDLEQGRRLAQELLPQAVLIDQATTDQEATDLETIVQHWDLPHIPFLVCPLPGEEPLRQRLDVNGYLIKPVSRSSLRDALRSFGENVDRLLVIDDDRDFVRLMRQMLSDPVRQYQVSSAYSGREGLEKVFQARPDLLLLDLLLPDISGLQIIEQIRADAALHHLPIIVVTGEEEIDNLEILCGTARFAKSGGLTPGEIVQWIQSVLDAQITRGSS